MADWPPALKLPSEKLTRYTTPHLMFVLHGPPTRGLRGTARGTPPLAMHSVTETTSPAELCVGQGRLHP